jgi:hypothetical protein
MTGEAETTFSPGHRFQAISGALQAHNLLCFIPCPINASVSYLSCDFLSSRALLGAGLLL